jgi:hypothetical protein
MISLYFQAVDDIEGWTEDAATVEEAVSTFHFYMGSNYEIGSCYAVSGDGIVTCSLIGDSTWEDLQLA